MTDNVFISDIARTMYALTKELDDLQAESDQLAYKLDAIRLKQGAIKATMSRLAHLIEQSGEFF